MTLRGMTWDHPRAYEPLTAFAAAVPEAGLVEWDRQSPADFEARSIAQLAGTYDLLVLDHPGVGAAVASDALLPLDTVLSPTEMGRWRDGAIGSSWDSYTWLDQQWALPIDVTAQVSVRRPELVPVPPADWSAVAAVAAERRVALCLGGPHALLTVLGMSAPTRTEADLADAIGLLRGLWDSVDQKVSLLDPIGVHEAMAAEPDLAYCPLAFGYAGYARSGLAWSAAPERPGGGPGSVLGGAGLAISSLCSDREGIRRWARAFLDPDVQSGLVAAAGGQPAALAAWDSAEVDAAWGGFYSATRSSVLAAWVRPRRSGWIKFQDRASALVRAAVTGDGDAAPVAAEIAAELVR